MSRSASAPASSSRAPSTAQRDRRRRALSGTASPITASSCASAAAATASICSELTGGSAVTIYAQHEVIKDLIAARLAAGGRISSKRADVSVHDFDGASPTIRFVTTAAARAGVRFYRRLRRLPRRLPPSIPAGVLTYVRSRIPIRVAGHSRRGALRRRDELIYAYHERGFALHSMRSPTITRLYLQCTPDEDSAIGPTSESGTNWSGGFATATDGN